MIFFGVKQIYIGADETYMRCPSCESHTDTELLISGKYFHIYWIPFWPFEKEMSSVCSKCGLKRYNLPIEDKFISDAAEMKRKFKYPWFTYIGLAAVSFVIAFIIVSCFR